MTQCGRRCSAGRCSAAAARSAHPVLLSLALRSQVRFPPNGWWTDWWFYIKNNHIFLSIFLAHDSHPYTRKRRFLVLLNSLSFAFFVTALFQSLVPNDVAAAALILFYGTMWQIIWDVPAAMLGTCPCANMGCLPTPVRRCCGCVSFGCLFLHAALGLVLGVIGALLLMILPSDRVRRPAPPAPPAPPPVLTLPLTPNAYPVRSVKSW